MARRGGYRRTGSKRRFRYVDARGRRIVDEPMVERIDALRIPPPWKNGWISSRAGAGRRQYLYQADCRARHRYERDGELYDLTTRRLNDYVREHMGEEYTAKDFRTWGGTLTAAIAFAARELPERESEQKRRIAAVMGTVAQRSGNTPAVARASYVGPAIVEQYLDGRTIDDFRPRNLRVVRGRDTESEVEEKALLPLLRSWRIRSSRKAA